MKYSVLVVMLLLLVSPGLRADVPSFVTYSGRLTDGTGWGESNQLTLTFELYAEAEGGEAFWTGMHPNIPVVDGYFTVNLGMCDGDGACTPNPADASFPSNLPAQMWVGVVVDGVELSPRQPVGSVPYAVFAGKAEEAVNAGENILVLIQQNTAKALCAAWKQSLNGIGWIQRLDMGITGYSACEQMGMYCYHVVNVSALDMAFVMTLDCAAPTSYLGTFACCDNPL